MQVLENNLQQIFEYVDQVVDFCACREDNTGVITLYLLGCPLNDVANKGFMLEGHIFIA